MADAMVRMMEAMGMFDPQSMASMPMPTPFGSSAWSPGLGGFGMPGGSPWGMLQDPSAAIEKGGKMAKQFSEGMPLSGGSGTGSFPWESGSPLEGVWEGRNGELLIVKGNRFRIYPGTAGYLDGYLRTSGDKLALYNPEDANIRPFEYAKSEGRLALRDDAGAVYLYRRLWMDAQKTPAASTMPEK
jgi:hypothetical protein